MVRKRSCNYVAAVNKKNLSLIQIQFIVYIMYKGLQNFALIRKTNNIKSLSLTLYSVKFSLVGLSEQMYNLKLNVSLF